MTNKKEVEIRLLQSIFNILLASLMAIIGWVSLAINTRLQEIGILFVIICYYLFYCRYFFTNCYIYYWS